MKDYDFKKLSSDEFEDFSRHLLNRYYSDKYPSKGIYFLSTNKGRDEGIDLYHSSERNDFEIIVQVKHYAGSSLSHLMNSLFGSKGASKGTELEKVKRINPVRYILVTSLNVPLSKKQEIKKKFSPFIGELKDIIDYRVLNNLLEDYPDIEKRFIKLYFTSAEVMRQVVFFDSIGYGRFIKDHIENKIKVFVDTGIFSEAEKQLKDSRVLIVTGEPGSGKTTLAEILIYKYLKEKYHLGYILNNISKADEVWVEGLQIFYYDDFLGQNFYETEFAQKEERPLYNFIERIKKTEDKLFVLTTRTIIYNHARDGSERFRQIRSHSSNVQIEVKKLSHDDKVLMIKNHLEFKEVPKEIKNDLTKEEISIIADHPNFYPRIIDFVTDKLSLQLIIKERLSLFNYTVKVLETPNEIWKLCYEKQIGEAERMFINTMFSIGNLTNECLLRTAFEKRYLSEFNLSNTSINKWISFEDCYSSLNEAFIVNIYDYSGQKLIGFINPSVVDFLLSYLPKYPLELRSIIKASAFIEQLFLRFRSDADNISGPFIKTHLPSDFFELIAKNEIAFKSIYDFTAMYPTEQYLRLYRLFLLIMYFRQENKFEIYSNKILQKIDFDKIDRIHFTTLKDLFLFVSNKPVLRQTVLKKWDSIIHLMISKSETISELTMIFQLFTVYQKSIEEFMTDDINVAAVKKVIDEYRELDISETIYHMKESVLNIEDVHEEYSRILESIRLDYRDNYIPSEKIEIDKWVNIDWYEVIKKNEEKKFEEAHEKEMSSEIFERDDDESFDSEAPY